MSVTRARGSVGVPVVRAQVRSADGATRSGVVGNDEGFAGSTHGPVMASDLDTWCPWHPDARRIGGDGDPYVTGSEYGVTTSATSVCPTFTPDAVVMATPVRQAMTRTRGGALLRRGPSGCSCGVHAAAGGDRVAGPPGERLSDKADAALVDGGGRDHRGRAHRRGSTQPMEDQWRCSVLHGEREPAGIWWPPPLGTRDATARARRGRGDRRSYDDPATITRVLAVTVTDAVTVVTGREVVAAAIPGPW